MKSTIVLLVLALSVVACDQSKEAPSDGAEGAPTAAEPAADEAAESEDSKTVEGKIVFSVDGEKKSFTYMPAEENNSMSVITRIVGRPEAGATEEFSIVVMNFDAKKAELPKTLKLDMKKAMQGGDPMEFTKAPKPIVEYKSAEGVIYRTYGEVVFESNAGGVVKGKVTDMRLGTIKPKDKNETPVQISGLNFQVAL